MDDRLRKLTDDIGRGKPVCDHCGRVIVSAQVHDAWHEMTRDIPLASDAMAERDEHGEVKGLYF